MKTEKEKEQNWGWVLISQEQSECIYKLRRLIQVTERRKRFNGEKE